MNAVLKRAAPAAAQPFALRCADGRRICAHWIPAVARRAVLVVNAGTGFPQTFYMRLAGYAAERGYDTLVYDYRGMGRSAPPDSVSMTCGRRLYRQISNPRMLLRMVYGFTEPPRIVGSFPLM